MSSEAARALALSPREVAGAACRASRAPSSDCESIDLAAARRDERHLIAQQLRGLGEGFLRDAEHREKRDLSADTARTIAGQLGWVAAQVDPDQAVRSVPGAATGGTE